jgi:hypothetical protein
MRMMLRARDLWTVVGEGTTDYTKDHMALENISKAVPMEMMGSMVSKPSAKAVWVWESIILWNVGVDQVHKTKASTIKRKFDSLRFHDDESVDDHGTRISQMTNQLAVQGIEDKEEEIMRWFRQASPPKFE